MRTFLIWCRSFDHLTLGKKEHVRLLLNLIAFKVMIEEADSRLIGFFDMMHAICYIMVAQRNMSANKFALNIGLFLDSTGSTNESIDAMHKIGVSVCAGTVDLHKTKIARDHKTNIKEYFQQNKKEVPMLTWLSTGHHMTTCICKQITSYPQIPNL
ncbi:hypothetical protein GLOIN_2v1779376 [Rhizophagus irregularis DAOM 181602=DAOM 197198]|nr:hypothetical protein GLOIN_2v1779376 [Rhizophagus irregularis DAOM 181602=DAOM 197198]